MNMQPAADELDQVARISPEKLKARLDDEQLPGAIRIDPVHCWKPLIQNRGAEDKRLIVAYCNEQTKGELSERHERKI